MSCKIDIMRNFVRRLQSSFPVRISRKELQEAMADTDYQVMGYRVGDAVVADRCLLYWIPYEDIELACNLMN